MERIDHEVIRGLVGGFPILKLKSRKWRGRPHGVQGLPRKTVGWTRAYRVTLRLRRRISITISAAPAAIQITACNIVLLIRCLPFLSAPTVSHLKVPSVHRCFPPKRCERTRGSTCRRAVSAGLFGAHVNYRDALRFLRRIINITSAAPAAIQMIACKIVLLMVWHLLS